MAATSNTNIGVGTVGLFDEVEAIEQPSEESYKPKRRKYRLFDFLNDLNYNKRGIIHEDADAIKDFSPFIINRAMGMGEDTVLFANEMNMRYWLDPDMVYDFYLYGLRKAKRFNKWAKRDEDDKELIDMVCELFDVSYSKAIEILPLLTESDVDDMETALEKGGMN